MDTKRFGLRAGLVAGAAAAFISGAAWHGLAAVTAAAPATTAQAATQAPVVTGRAAAVNGSRDSYADVVKAVAPAVVTIRVDGKATASPAQFDGDDFFRRFFGDDDQPGQRRQRIVPRNFRQHGLGSGVVVTSDGYVLTNNHVVDGADTIHVDLTDGRTLEAKVIGTDKGSDLALVKINATGLPIAPLGNSDNAQVGDVVLAIGNPLNVGQTVTMGIVSAKGRSTGAGNGYQDFLQTDAPINHGNSGGALVNTKGEVIGINAEMLSPVDANIGIGFAIPSNMARHVMDDLKKDGRVRRAQLGVEVQPVTSDLADSLGLKHVGGAIIGKVTPDSAADHAGLKRGDVILSFNGQPVNDINSLRNHVAESQPGSTASVVVNRDGGEKTVTVKLDEAGKSEVASRRERGSDSGDKAALGISVEKRKEGLVITDVDPDGRAADAGLQAGDIIQEVNRKPAESVDDLRAAVRARADRPVLLLVERDGHTRYVTVRPSKG